MNNRPTIELEGIDDATLAANIEETICESLDAVSLSGPWSVAVAPSGVIGRWDFRVCAPNVRHTFSIAAPARLLATLIPLRLPQSLERSRRCQSDRIAAYPWARARKVTMASVSAAGSLGRVSGASI
jgi:hypothetical protein